MSYRVPKEVLPPPLRWTSTGTSGHLLDFLSGYGRFLEIDAHTYSGNDRAQMFRRWNYPTPIGTLTINRKKLINESHFWHFSKCPHRRLIFMNAFGNQPSPIFLIIFGWIFALSAAATPRVMMCNCNLKQIMKAPFWPQVWLLPVHGVAGVTVFFTTNTAPSSAQIFIVACTYV